MDQPKLGGDIITHRLTVNDVRFLSLLSACITEGLAVSGFSVFLISIVGVANAHCA
jgi:hypothetical protein